MAKKLYILCGPPASGKTTWASKRQGAHISRDKIRFSLVKTTEQYFSKEKVVYDTFIKEIQRALQNNLCVYADATHLTKTSRLRLLSNLNLENVDIYLVVFCLDVETCVHRNSLRSGREQVPEAALRNMYKTYEAPSMVEGDYNYKKIIYIS